MERDHVCLNLWLIDCLIVGLFVQLIDWLIDCLLQTSLLALAPACLVTGLHHVVMERDHGTSNILLIGCNRTSGQVVCSNWRFSDYLYVFGSLSLSLQGNQFSGTCRAFDLVVGWSRRWRWDIQKICSQKLIQKGSRGLTIAGGSSCASGLGLLLLLPQLNKLKSGSEMLAAAVPALLGVGDGLINLQVLSQFWRSRWQWEKYVCLCRVDK